jgi:predicted anti-sigma-YlaC factor YlaD
MECKTVRSLLEPYILGMLEEEDLEAVEAHLETCLPCNRRRMEAQQCARKTDELLSQTLGPQVRAPDSLRSNLNICLKCIEEPGNFTCPRLARLYMRLAPPLPPGV